MVRKMGKRQENLLAKIAAQLQMDVGEIKEKAAPLYSHEEEILERQSIINFYKARVKPERLKVKENGRLRDETDKEFEARYNEWRFMLCKNCDRMFAYAYSYDGVNYCSLECLDDVLQNEIGIELTRNKNPKTRWGLKHPAIVPPSALEALRLSLPDPEDTFDVPVQIVLPKLRVVQDSSDTEQDQPENIAL